MVCETGADSDQPGHPSSLIRDFAVCMAVTLSLSYALSAQPGLQSEWLDAQADLNLTQAHMPLCWFSHVPSHFTFNEPSKIAGDEIFFFFFIFQRK